MKRLFIALDLPKACQQELRAIDPGIAGLRWLKAETMHVTLSFLGDVGDHAQERLEDALQQIRVPHFFLDLHGLGSFGGARPTVVWAGVGKGHPHLFALYKHIQDAVLKAALEPDLRSFHPHITIGRARNVSRAALQPFLKKHAKTEFGLWRVNEFALFSSLLSSNGATHSLERRYALA